MADNAKGASNVSPESLRTYATAIGTLDTFIPDAGRALREAADEIERLRSESQIRAALLYRFLALSMGIPAILRADTEKHLGVGDV